jgi:heavy metal sensor kinase
MDQERRQLGELAAVAIAVGMVTLVLMLAGGWLLTGRALTPIDRITRAAARVSATNLSERIDVDRMETELVELARSINATLDRLQEAFDRQTRFTADASHELRTPLSVILCQSDLSLNQDLSNEEREAWTTVRRAARRMRAVVEGLLTLARADAGQAQLAMQPVNFGQVVKETCALLLPLADERRLTVAVDAQPVWVVGDQDRLCEVVSNLMSNAVYHNRLHGSVAVSLRAENGAAELVVSDTGAGMSESDRSRIFSRFFRADSARLQTATGGSGLGLAITKWIIEAHGGTIDCFSKQGEGSTFVVRLKATSVDRPAD